MLVSGVQQSDSVIHIHVSILFQIFFPLRLLQNIEQSSLRYTVGPCWLSISSIVVCIPYYRFRSLHYTHEHLYTHTHTHTHTRTHTPTTRWYSRKTANSTANTKRQNPESEQNFTAFLNQYTGLSIITHLLTGPSDASGLFL